MNEDDEMVLYQQVVRSSIYAMLCIWLDLAYPTSRVNPSLDIGLWSNTFFNIYKVIQITIWRNITSKDG
jgi:hypothetical protein